MDGMDQGTLSWEQVDREINNLARAGGIHSPREVEFHVELDRLAAMYPELGIMTEAEALEWADEQGLP
jgi:hypothetical protein